MQMKAIKFAVLLLASAAALALSSALPVQSLPQWITIKTAEERGDLIYNFNSIKSLLYGIKQVDTYFPDPKIGAVMCISCPRWRFIVAAKVPTEWEIIPPDSLIEALAYKSCDKN